MKVSSEANVALRFKKTTKNDSHIVLKLIYMKTKLFFLIFVVCFGLANFAYAQPGFSCSTPNEITSLPFTTTGNTANYGDLYDTPQPSACAGTSSNYMSGNDVFYSYTPTTDGVIEIKMLPTATYSGIFVYDGCENLGVTCLAGVANSGTTARVISNLNVLANHTYIVAISTWQPPQTTGYTLEIKNITCFNPTNLTATEVTQNQATLSWDADSSALYEIYFTTCTGAAPTATTAGIITTSSPFVVTGLSLLTCYKFYIRKVCSETDKSNWVASTNITTLGLPIEPPSCGGIFTDNGGANANYGSNQNSVYTICSETPGVPVSVYFNSFDIETNYDALYIYDGDSTAAPQIASANPAGNVPGGVSGGFWGTVSPGTVSANNPSGCLTFKFVSDSQINRPGWNANVYCTTLTCATPTAVAISQITTNSASIGWSSPANITQWEYLVQPSTSAVPTTATLGTLTTTPSVALTNLISGTSYSVFVRAVCSDTDKSFWSFNKTFLTTSCSFTSTLTVNQITTTTADVNFTIAANQSIEGVEILVQLASLPTPSIATTGTPLTSSVFNITNLICGTSYKIYTRKTCDGTASNWVLKNMFSSAFCVLTTGQPVNLETCTDSNTEHCFDFATNTAAILADLDPSLYTLTYHLVNNSTENPLTSPHCIFNTTETIYARLVKIATNEVQTLSFTIKHYNSILPIVLQNLSQCDDDGDNLVHFNLLAHLPASQNTYSFYLNNANAVSGINAIANPTAYSLPTPTGNFQIFAREYIEGACDNLYSFKLNAYTDCNLAYNCNQANAICGSLGIPFGNTHQSATADPGNNYGCLGSQPNPTWFYLPVSENGSLNLKVEQNATIDFTGQLLDVDYILYGPFADPVTPCSGGLTQNKIISCSYSGSGIEYPTIPNAVAGQYYLLMTTNFSNNAGFIRITLNPNSTGAMECSGIRMHAFLDANANGTKEVTEQSFPLGKFHYTKNTEEPHHIIAPSGAYTIYDNNEANSYNISYTINPEYVSKYAITTSSYENLHVVVGAGLSHYYFPITSIVDYQDVAVAIIPLTAPRAGFVYKNAIVYTNIGNQTVPSGTLTYTIDPATTITTISQAGTTATTTGFTYTYSNLLPFETRTILVTLQVPPIPSVALDQVLTNTVSITPTDADIVISNNNNSSSQSVIAAYDPNDKTEAHGEKILFTSFAENDYLQYTIRFENTGNASAINVSVKDELSPMLDENSIQMVSSSHNYTMDRVTNELVWNFNNIQLPVSVENTTIGKGYITFKVKLKPGFEVGDLIPNTANIYFDFNPAITTNTYVTEFTSTLENPDFKGIDAQIFPNPATDFVQIAISKGTAINRITVFDTLGNKVKVVSNVAAQTYILPTNELQSGVYLLEITTDNNTKITKKMAIK